MVNITKLDNDDIRNLINGKPIVVDVDDTKTIIIWDKYHDRQPCYIWGVDLSKLD